MGLSVILGNMIFVRKTKIFGNKVLNVLKSKCEKELRAGADVGGSRDSGVEDEGRSG
jgi:hypothetical protein